MDQNARMARIAKGVMSTLKPRSLPKPALGVAVYGSAFCINHQ